MNKILIAISLVGFGYIHSCKYEIFQWRGTNRNGIYNETGLLDHWPDQGPEMLWVYEGIGRGYASPVVSEDQVFVNGEIEGESFIFAFDLGGNLLWKSPNGDEFLGEGFSSTYPGARSTPTVLGNLVYTTSGKGRIACFETSSGAERWAVSIEDDLGGRVGEFGYSESVVVDNKKVYCFPGGQETNMAALDRFSGKTIWTSELLRDTFAYGSPVLVELPARKILIGTSRNNLMTVDTRNGELLGSYPLEGYEYDGEHCNTPVYSDGDIYFVGNDAEGQGAIRLELSEDGKKIREIWRNEKIRNNFGGFIVMDQYLFTSVKGNRLLSLEAEDGTVSDTLKLAPGSLVYADNKFICYGNNGDINLVSYNGDKLKITGKVKVSEGTGQHFSHPVLADGKMYIRHGNALMAYQIK